MPGSQAHSPAMGQEDGESVASIKMDRCGRFAADAPQVRQALKPKNTCMPTPPPPPNRYDRQEWAGALGDLGTLMPFVIAYVSVLKMNPSGILFAFGVCMVVCGWYYRTPFPVQPMKAAGAVTVALRRVVAAAGAVLLAAHAGDVLAGGDVGLAGHQATVGIHRHP